MKRRIVFQLELTVLLFIIFAVFTVAVKAYDVAPVGPVGTEVGFSSMNANFAEYVGFNKPLYVATQILGYFALLVCAGFAALGFSQLYRRKSIKRVSPDLILLGVFYLIVIAVYLLFEVAVINYRPVLISDETFPAASYPSSHTVLAVCVFSTASVVVRRLYYRRVRFHRILGGSFLALAALTVVGRAFSGVHWLTDIIGGVLLSLALVSLFITGLIYADYRLGRSRTYSDPF